MNANTAAVRAKLMTALTTCASNSQPPKIPPHHLPSAARPALNTNDTISRKAMAKIIPNASSRARSKFHAPLDLARAGARQMRSSASCSSPNTELAPNSSTATPTTVAVMPSEGLLTLANIASMPVAASWPIKPCSWPNISPRAASAPNTKPAMAITINSSGAREKTV